MDIIEWIRIRCPGKIEKFEDRIEIAHDSGDYSTVWLNKSNHKREGLQKLKNIYFQYDGMNFFSSTFRIASVNNPKIRNNVVLVQTLQHLSDDIKIMKPEFPEKSIPFMRQDGIGFYAVGIKSGIIFEWDESENELSGEYKSVIEVIDEWLEAIGK